LSPSTNRSCSIDPTENPIGENTRTRSILKRLARRHTTAVAYLALFAAFGGSAYAAGTITGKNNKDGTITGTDVKNRSIGADKLTAAALSSLAGERGTGPAGTQGPNGATGSVGPTAASGPVGLQGLRGGTGPAGPAGPAGTSGPAGPSGISGLEYHISSGVVLGTKAANPTQANCAAGKKALGGGASSNGPLTYVIDSAPTDHGAGWVVWSRNTSDTTEATVYAWVIRANVAP
jgi:hypothetical protein